MSCFPPVEAAAEAAAAALSSGSLCGTPACSLSSCCHQRNITQGGWGLRLLYFSGLDGTGRDNVSFLIICCHHDLLVLPVVRAIEQLPCEIRT